MPVDNVLGSRGDRTGVVFDGNSELTPKFARIEASASGDTVVVAAVASKKIRVLSLYFQSANVVNVEFFSDTGGTSLTGPLQQIGATGGAPAFNPLGHFETIAGEGLYINLDTAVQVGGFLTYIEV